jgi:hypothetical protein
VRATTVGPSTVTKGTDVDFRLATTAPTTTAGYDAYWEFATKRQNVYLRRLAGHTGPLTNDPVLIINRFTNAYRAADRVSQHLITEVLYDRERNWVDTFARTLVFKVFNRIGTWEHVIDRLGDVDADTVVSGAVDAAVGEVADRQPVYSAAYIMPPPQDRTGPKYVRHLSLIRTMLADGAPDRIAEATTMADAYEVLADYPSVGPFLAYQFVTDLNYSSHLSFSETEFVVPGPGAIRGLKKCFSDPGGYSPADLIRRTADMQHDEFARRGLDWHDLWGRDLQLIDAQNLFCEVDKYTRVANPELSAYAPGTRIKQRYRRDRRPVTAWFPPQWGINDRIMAVERQDVPEVDGQLALV